LKDYLLDLKFYRIINGYFNIRINGHDYKIIYPDNEIKYEAEKLYVSLMQDSRFDTEYLNDAQLEKILIHNNIWSLEQQVKLNGIEKEIDKIKVKLYQNYSRKETRKKIKTELKILREYHNELFSSRHSLDYLTLDFFATNIKNQYLISQCILNEQNEKVFDSDYYKIDLDLLKNFIQEIDKHKITPEDLRNICKSDSWKRYVCQDNIFGPSIYLNDDQTNLLSLQKMYDNVRQHHDSPDEEVIDDPDALDGWFIFQREENKKNKKKNKALDKVRGKVGSHDFVYVMTRDMEEAEAIEDMNDFRGKQLVDSVRKSAKLNEFIPWKDVPFVQQELKSNMYRNQKQGVPQQ
jgi:hypothetical protein